jgi:hypothetical protein
LQLHAPPDSATFHRTRAEALFRGAHILVARAIDNTGFVQAAFIGRDASFNDSIIGIAAPAQSSELLQALTAILNSSVVRYLLFLVATSWGVERPRLEAQDLRALPLALPDDRVAGRLARLAGDASRVGITARDRLAIDDIVARLYGLSDRERRQVDDCLRYGIDLHYRKAKSDAFAAPDAEALDAYGLELGHQLGEMLGVEASTRVVSGDSPWATVSVGLGQDPPDTEPHAQTLAAASHTAQEGSGAIVLRRTARVYQAHGIVMTKPAEARHWTRSAALQDADDVVAECLRAAAADERLASLGASHTT